jgi:hypothetical protein
VHALFRFALKGLLLLIFTLSIKSRYQIWVLIVVLANLFLFLSDRRCSKQLTDAHACNHHDCVPKDVILRCDDQHLGVFRTQWQLGKQLAQRVEYCGITGQMAGFLD